MIRTNILWATRTKEVRLVLVFGKLVFDLFIISHCGSINDAFNKFLACLSLRPACARASFDCITLLVRLFKEFTMTIRCRVYIHCIRFRILPSGKIIY